jgi:hypothetical protein
MLKQVILIVKTVFKSVSNQNSSIYLSKLEDERKPAALVQLSHAGPVL